MRAAKLPQRKPVVDRQLEKTVEQHLVSEVEARGGRALKLTMLLGWPDRLVFVLGQIWVVECKRPKRGRYGPLQARIGAWLTDGGYNYRLLKTRDEVDAWLAGL